MRGRTLLGLAMLSAVTGCEGCFIDGLQDTRAVVTVSPSPTLDFGQVDVTQRRVQSITITNTGDRNYNDLTFRLTPETDPAFKLGTDLPAFVPLGGSIDTDAGSWPFSWAKSPGMSAMAASGADAVWSSGAVSAGAGAAVSCATMCLYCSCWMRELAAAFR